MQGQEISVDDVDSIEKYIKDLSYAGHGCLSLYWEICKRKSTNARLFIDFFPVGSRAFRSKHRLWKKNEDYERRRWTWIRKILVKLRSLGFVDIEPIQGSPRLSLQPARKFKHADYILRPRISKLIFRFPKQDGEKALKDIVSVHRFVMRFIPRHIPPRYVSKGALKHSARRKIKKAKGIVIINFPA